MVLQSRKMARIQAGISGGFDAIAGLEILDAVQGLIRSQQRYSEGRVENQEWPFAPVADVRDATVARFAAGRFRRTYRSLRPLLEDRELVAAAEAGNAGEDDERPTRMVRTQAELDDEARAFALGLIENWLEDPSNVRLLRIGLAHISTQERSTVKWNFREHCEGPPYAALRTHPGSRWSRSLEIARVLICEMRLSLTCISTATSRLCQPKS
jgi:hypothetical protein